MSNNDNLGLFTLTSPLVTAHPALVAARAFKRDGKDKGEPKFGLNFLFKPDAADFLAAKDIAIKVARARWPGRDLKTLKFPFSSGDKLADKRKEKGKDDGDFQRGFIVMVARSKYQPKMGYLEGGRMVELDGDAAVAAAKDKFYFGVECFAQFNFVAYEGGTGPDGVTAYLQSVLSTGKGKKLASGGASLAETFKSYVGTITGEDPMGGADLDDEIPF